MKSKMFLHKETLPLEIPINFSNTNLKYVDKKFLNTTKWTIPMAFLVPKTNGEEVRNLSLPHPLAQIKMMNFIEQFDSNITSFVLSHRIVLGPLGKLIELIMPS